jgi:hypothetical protein
MKKKDVYVELNRTEILVIVIAASAVNFIWFLPIIIQLDDEITIFLSISLYALLLLILAKYLATRQIEKIKERIDKSTRNHIRDFFDFMEKDEQFSNDVLLLKVDLYDFERKKIGNCNVYSKLRQKRDKFLENIDY